MANGIADIRPDPHFLETVTADALNPLWVIVRLRIPNVNVDIGTGC